MSVDSVTFAKYKVTVTKNGDGETIYSESLDTTGTSPPALSFHEIAKSTRRQKMIQGVSGGMPIDIDMGFEGPYVKCRAYLYDTNADTWASLLPGQLLFVSATEYSEFPASTYWKIDEMNISGKAGWRGRREFEFSFIRSWYKADGTLRT